MCIRDSLYGHPASMGPLRELADRQGLKLFEDAAQAHGASLGGTPVGAFGQFAMFSLYPVSYTHLDVYKRQGIDSGGCERRRAGAVSRKPHEGDR